MAKTKWLVPKAVAQDDSVYDDDTSYFLRNTIAITKDIKQAYPYLFDNFSSSLPEEDYMYTPGAYSTPYPFLHDVRIVKRGELAGSNLIGSDLALSRNSGGGGASGVSIVSNSSNSVDTSIDYARVAALNSSTISWDNTYDHGLRNQARGFDAAGSAKVTNASAPVAVRMFGTNEAQPASGFKHYAECWVYTTVARSFRLYDPVNNNYDTGYTIAVPANQWTRLRVEFTGAGTYASLAVAVNVAGATFYVDDASIRYTGVYTQAVTVSDTVTEVKRQDYGIAVEFKVDQVGWKSGDDTFYTEHLKLTGLQPDIPAGATVTGAEVRLEVASKRMFQPPGYPQLFAFYNIKVRYEFTYDLVLEGDGSSQGYIHFVQQPEPAIDMKRTYQYMIYENGQFMGEWTDVANDPDELVAVNSFPSEMVVNLNRTPMSRKSELDGWNLVADTTPEEFVIDTGESVIVEVESSQAFGAGTDLNVNHDVDVVEYYGGYENLIFDDGEEWITDELEPIATEIGYPNGRMHFRGWVSKLKKSYRNPRQGTVVTLLSHADEYNHIVFETSDTAVQYADPNGVFLGIGYYANGTFTTVPVGAGQSFTLGGTTELAGVQIYMKGWNTLDDPESWYPWVTVRLKSNVPGSGSVIATARIQVKPVASWHSVAFPGVELAAGTYGIEVIADGIASGYAPPPVQVYKGTTYANGAAYTLNETYDPKGGGGTWGVSTGNDIAFRVMQRGGLTSVLQASQDPTTMAKNIIDYGSARGSRLIYTPTSLIPSNTAVTARFNVNTLKEAMDGVLKYLPTDWFWRFDQAELAIYVQPRPSEVTQVFELGNDIEYLDLEYSLEQLVNEVYFTGGQKQDSTTLFRHYVDQPSQQQWRPGLSKSSDQRVTTDVSADIVVDAAIARGNQPIYVADLS